MNSTTVWKYELPIAEEFVLRMPAGARPLKVEMQNHMACLWALVDPDRELEERVFAIRGTGHPLMAAIWQWIGTFQMPPFVWHLFEIDGRLPPPPEPSEVLRP